MTLNKQNIYFLIGGIILTFLIWNFIIGKKETEKVVLKSDTVSTIKYIDKPIYITKWKAKIDSISYPVTIIEKDTVWQNIAVASADTLITQDSSYVKIKYYFPPANYFNVDMRIKEKTLFQTVTNEVPHEETFWDRFGYSLQGGFGYGLINKNFDVYVGVGVHIKLK